LLPFIIGRVPHNSDSFDMRWRIRADRRGIRRRYFANGSGEHESKRINARLNCRFNVLRFSETTDFHEDCHAAAPASRIAATSAVGSSLRIKAVPTSAI